MIVAFEGIDGSGKTTLGPLVADELSHRGLNVRFVPKRYPKLPDGFARDQLAVLSDRLWGTPHDERLDTVGTPHWIFLNAAYFSGLWHATEDCFAPQVTIFDNWIYKFAARMFLHGGSLADTMRAVLSAVPAPQHTVLIDLPPEVAAERRPTANPLEQGRLSAGSQGFVPYQHRVAQELRGLGISLGWSRVETAGLSPSETARLVADVLESKRDADHGGSWV